MSDFIDDYESRLRTFLEQWKKSPHASEDIRICFSRFASGIIIAVYTSVDSDPVATFAIRRDEWQKVLDLIPEESITFAGMTWDKFREIETQ